MIGNINGLTSLIFFASLTLLSHQWIRMSALALEGLHIETVFEKGINYMFEFLGKISLIIYFLIANEQQFSME